MFWIIVGPDVPDVKIKADSFDEALRKARLRDEDYCGGYVESEATMHRDGRLEVRTV